MSLLFSGGWDDGVGVINPDAGLPVRAVQGNSPEIGGILDRLVWKSSAWDDLFLDFLTIAFMNDELTKRFSASSRLLTVFFGYCL
jgi:hypothetical protein